MATSKTNKPPTKRSMKDLINGTAGNTGDKPKRRRNANPDNDIEHDQGEVKPKVKTEDSVSEKKPLIDITKAKINNEIFLYVEYNEHMKDGNFGTKKDCDAPVHEDLKKAFKKLNYFLARLSEQYDEKGEVDAAKTTCRTFTVGNDGEGVTLSGTRILESGKAFNFNSPYIKWDDEGAEKLRVTINQCKAEVNKYLFEGKHQPEAQQSLDFKEETDTSKEL